MRKEDKLSPTSGIVAAAAQRARIGQTLQQALTDLDRLEPTTTTQRLKLALELFQRSVEAWITQPPTEEELLLVQEHIAEVLDLVRRKTPRERLSRSA
jgi:hypothetical protein